MFGRGQLYVGANLHPFIVCTWPIRILLRGVVLVVFGAVDQPLVPCMSVDLGTSVLSKLVCKFDKIGNIFLYM